MRLRAPRIKNVNGITKTPWIGEEGGSLFSRLSNQHFVFQPAEGNDRPHMGCAHSALPASASEMEMGEVVVQAVC